MSANGSFLRPPPKRRNAFNRKPETNRDARGMTSKDPCHLAWQVNKIPLLDLTLSNRQDPCRLARQVNQILTLSS